MANQEHLDILKQGVEVWNQWREEHPDIQPDLSEAKFIGVNLKKANLSGVDLSKADLSGADLSGADLSEAKLIEATLSGGVRLNNATLSGANLLNINLSTAQLIETIFSGANLSGANLSVALLNSAQLDNVNLSGARLDNAILNGANISNSNLRGTDFSGANLYRVNLNNAILSGANLRHINLREANLSGADLRDTDLRFANLIGAKLNRADLSGAILISVNLTEADLTDCRIYGTSVWDVQLEGAKQANLVITLHQPTITVDNLEVAQFIYLLLDHKKLRDVLNTVTERGVLILGRFSGGGLELLQAIAAKLREENYLPIIFDFERPQGRNYTETIKTLAGLARFVIADLSGPSVPQELYATVPHFKIPFVPIIKAGRKPYSMAVDIFEYPWVVRPPITFTTTEELLEQMPTKVIAPAEEKHQARQKLLDELFNKA